MKYIIATFALLFGSGAFAQNSSDALLFSRNDISGSARYVAMGGSFGALGGEISGISVNPGGIGVYRNSEFTLSTGFNNYSSETSFRGSTKTDGRFNINLPSFGYIGNYKGDANTWKSYSFGIIHNRMNHFSAEQRAFGNSSNSTYIDDYVTRLNSNGANAGQAANYNSYPFGEAQAWNTVLIDTLTNPNTGIVEFIPYVFLFQIADSTVTGRPSRTVDNIAQSRILDTRGNQSETQFVFGGNFQDRLYLGASISFQTVNFEKEVSFREDYTYGPNATSLDSHLVVAYQEDTRLETSGRGVNLKLGGIYRVNDAFRVGLSVQTPTIMNFDEVFFIDAKSEFGDGFELRADSVTATFGYRLRTPARINASIAYLFMQKAAINIEYEFVDYSTAFFNDRTKFSNDYSAQNDEIENLLVSAHNIRVGAEYKFNPFVIRAGYNYQGNPYDDNLTIADESRNTYSFGGGFRNNNFNFDVGINWRKMNINENFYSSTDAIATIEERETNVVFTVGWRW
ncbi:MAG: hypothetical protein ACJAV5_000083 [Vicingaceae bacterium]|jgi:hypothetical protein